MNSVRESFTGLDAIFIDALVAEEYDVAYAAAVLGGLRIQQARENHALAEGFR